MVTVLDPTTLQAVVPPAASAAPVPVEVTTRNGSSPFGPTFTYNATPVTPPNITGVSPSSGDMGTEVTISGEDFQTTAPGPTVTICSQLVTPDSSSATEVVFTAPACATGGPQDVTVTNPDGGTDTLPASFVYPGAGVSLPAIGGISPASGPVTGGTLVTISGANFLLDTKVRFGSAPSPAVSVDGPTRLQVQVPPAPGGAVGPVNVVVTTPIGSATLTAGFTYTSEPAPVPPSISDISPSEGDPGTPVTITGAGFQVPGVTVSLCGQSVTPTSGSATEINFTAPTCQAGGP
ncbi:MAG: hypothetical protein GEV06_28700, partial [Luteitalea sp.]|nr:hypothetical protein [Luteitalea sp.]